MRRAVKFRDGRHRTFREANAMSGQSLAIFRRNTVAAFDEENLVGREREEVAAVDELPDGDQIHVELFAEERREVEIELNN